MAKPEKLNIALLAPLVTPIASPFLGGAQVLLNDLAQGLVARGHQVTIYAAKGSRVDGVKTIESPVEPGELAMADFNQHDRSGSEQNAIFYKQAELFLEIFLQIARDPGFDIAHAHAFDWPVFAYAPLCRVPVVHTVHLPAVDESINKIIQTGYKHTGSSNAVTVSQACATTYSNYFPFDRVIYNGVRLETIPFNERPEDFLLFVGRMSPEKGADRAIQIALKAGKKLVLAGGLYDQDFFNREIAPWLERYPDRLQYAGHLGRDEVYALMGRVTGLIFPSLWAEPFGLVPVEAQAAGTPVIAFNSGATPETIIAGETGFLVAKDDIDGAAAAVSRLKELERAACRAHVAANFTIETMLDQYEEYYYQKRLQR